MPMRVVWFVIVGWWLGAILGRRREAPSSFRIRFFDTVASLLGEVPCRDDARLALATVPPSRQQLDESVAG